MGHFLRSLSKLQTVDVGFSGYQVLVLSLDPEEQRDTQARGRTPAKSNLKQLKLTSQESSTTGPLSLEPVMQFIDSVVHVTMAAADGIDARKLEDADCCERTASGDRHAAHRERRHDYEHRQAAAEVCDGHPGRAVLQRAIVLCMLDGVADLACRDSGRSRIEKRLWLNGVSIPIGSIQRNSKTMVGLITRLLILPFLCRILRGGRIFIFD
jgi:hypothetical protein